jgi:branched-chain amino acid transport system ATP-binding protein
MTALQSRPGDRFIVPRRSGPPPLLEARGLTMAFGGVKAVDDVDFDLGEMELRCLIGPNGAGKSTFFKMLTGQLRPTDGRIRLREHAISGALPYQIARLGIGIKTQIPNVFDGLSVADNVLVAAGRNKSRPRARHLVEATLARLQLTTLASAIVGTLAHGVRQWVELAMVLAQEPELILLDEPIAGMSAAEIDRTAELIVEINRTNAIVVVEHDMAFIRQIAKTVTVFHQGRILTQGDVASVLADQRVHDVYLGTGSVPLA